MSQISLDGPTLSISRKRKDRNLSIPSESERLSRRKRGRRLNLSEPLPQVSDDSDADTPNAAPANDTRGHTESSIVSRRPVEIHVLSELLQKNRIEIERFMETELLKLQQGREDDGKRISAMEERMRRSSHVLSAIALRMSNSGAGKKIGTVRPDTQAQVGCVEKYLTTEIKAKAAIHINGKCVVAHFGKSQHSYDSALDVIEYLLFAPLAFERKEKRQTAPGRAWVDMRCSLIELYIYNCSAIAQKKAKAKEELLQTCQIPDECDGEEALYMHDAFVEEAQWTAKNYFSHESIDRACDEMLRIPASDNYKGVSNTTFDLKKEQKKLTMKEKKSAATLQTQDDEIRHEVVKEMWRLQTDWLNFARQQARSSITKSIGFLFSEKSKATWNFSVPRKYFGQVETIPRSTLYKDEDTAQRSLVNKSNIAQLQKMKSRFSDMSFLCRYSMDVHEKINGKWKADVVDTVEVNRNICILSVALEFLKEYHQIRYGEDFFRFVPESFKVLYLTGMAIGAMLEDASDFLKNESKDIQRLLGRRYPMFILVDSPSLRAKLINDSSLRMSVDSYNEMLSSLEQGPSEPSDNAQPPRRSRLLRESDIAELL